MSVERINELIDEVHKWYSRYDKARNMVLDLVEEMKLHEASLPPFIREVWLPMATDWLAQTDPASSEPTCPNCPHRSHDGICLYPVDDTADGCDCVTYVPSEPPKNYCRSILGPRRPPQEGVRQGLPVGPEAADHLPDKAHETVSQIMNLGAALRDAGL